MTCLTKATSWRKVLHWLLVWECGLSEQERHSSRSVKWLVTVHPWPEIRKRRTLGLGWFLLFPFELVCNSTLWIESTHIWVAYFPLTLILTHRQVQRCLSYVIPNPVKSMRKVNHQNPWGLPVFMPVPVIPATHTVAQTQLLRESWPYEVNMNCNVAIWSE